MLLHHGRRAAVPCANTPSSSAVGPCTSVPLPPWAARHVPAALPPRSDPGPAPAAIGRPLPPAAVRCGRALLAAAAGAASASPSGPAAPDSSRFEKIDGKVVSADTLFSKEYLFSLPPIQRPYDWNVENALELLEDISGSIDPELTIADHEQYMLGLVTLADSSSGSETRKQIIDGQQRIITLALILAAVRERLLSATDNKSALPAATATKLKRLAKSLEERLFQEGDPGIGLEDQPRIQLKSQADTFFLTQLLTSLEFVQQPEKRVEREGSSQPKLWANTQAVRKQLIDKDVVHCEMLAKYILQKVTFIVTVSSSFHLALRVFKTSAQRGVDLMAVDILKACVFEAVPSEHHEKYGEKWEQHEKDLGRDSGLSELARLLAIIFLGRHCTQLGEFDDLDAMFRAFAEQHAAATHRTAGGAGAGSSGGSGGAAELAAGSAGEAFVDEILTPFAEAYTEMEEYSLKHHASEDTACRAGYLLRVLGRFGTKKRDEWRAPVLAMLLLHRRRRLSDSELVAGLEGAERLLVAGTLCKWTPKERKERWLKVLRELGFEPSATYALVRRHHAAAPTGIGAAPPSLRLAQEEVAATLAALGGPVYDGYTKEVSRLLLMRLNEHVLNTAEHFSAYQDKGLTVEHVLPQKPGPGWEHLDDAAVRDEWVHRLGNLVLLAGRQNSKAGVQSWGKKKKIYSGERSMQDVNALPLTTEIARIDKWTLDVLKARQERMVALCKACWQLW